MYGIQAIRNINAAHAAKSEPVERYQAQYKGNAWHVFDSHTGGWGKAGYAKAFDAQQAADALNTAE